MMKNFDIIFSFMKSHLDGYYFKLEHMLSYKLFHTQILNKVWMRVKKGFTFVRLD